VTAQLAYAYPKLAELADLRGDHAFARELRTSGARDVATLRREWTGKGWYSRAYSGARQVGQGVIFGEPQPWAILAGAPRGRQAAWSESTRNTLANHATRFPNPWDGTISVDDACEAFYSAEHDFCGVSLTTSYEGQITEQPTWMVMDAIRLAGVTPTGAGYRIAPRYPFNRFSLRLPQIGVASEARRLRGYVTPQRAGPMQMSVQLPPGVNAGTLKTWSGT